MQLSATFHGDRGICSSRPWQWLLSDPKPSVFFEMEKLELDIQSLKKERDAAISQKVALFHCSLQAYISSHKDAFESVSR